MKLIVGTSFVFIRRWLIILSVPIYFLHLAECSAITSAPIYRAGEILTKEFSISLSSALFSLPA